MSIAEKVTQVAENVPKVYEAGQKSEYDRFWDVYQQNGNRRNYANAFSGAGWTTETFKPKYKTIAPTETAYMLFYNAYNLKIDLVDYCEKNGITLDFSQSLNCQYLFGNSCITRVGVIDTTKASAIHSLFYMSKNLHTIDKFIFPEKTSTYQQVFTSCVALENVTIEGKIKLSLDLKTCDKLTHSSLLSFLNALYDFSGDTSGVVFTLTLGETNIAKLTDEEMEIGYNKGWVIA